MTSPRWNRLKALYSAAAPIPEAEREAFLRAQGADEALAHEVMALLAAHPPSEEHGEVAESRTGSPPVHSGEGPGSQIGPYRLIERIGEGGFGTVFVAEQAAPIRRLVAVKILKPGMDTAQVVARFEQERQALALMDHPHIARVFDGGTTPRGLPFFVMELVKGDPIIEYCDRERLSPAERLALFADVGRAVHHAHQKGVIHRDLKPSNVLVTLIDGRAVPKVIDFGVAKATQGRLTERTLFTEHQQMVGTPLYMSPEQAHISGVDVDTRSDVYSLGVLLYELLTGTTPFRLEELLQAGVLEMLRVLREVEPPKPSTRVATLGQTGGIVAAQRRVELARLGTLLRGDIDWIVMKCLEKERGRRYESASDLVRDVERHLAGEAVLAAPPSAAYRLRKFVRRHRAPVAATGAIALVATVGLGAFVSAERRRADDAQRSAEAREFDSYVANIQAADAALANKDVRTARAHLAACSERLRQWEWHYLDAASDRSEYVLSGHTAPVRFVAYDRKGERVVTTSDDGTARLWDPWTGEARGVLFHGNAPVVQALFHPDGRWVATRTETGETAVWDASSLTRLATLVEAAAGSKTNDFAWSRDGSQLATVVRGGPATLWTAGTWREQVVLGGEFEHDHVTFATAAERLVTWSRSYPPALWDTGSGRMVAVLRGLTDGIEGLQAIGDSIVASTADGHRTFWDCHDGHLVRAEAWPAGKAVGEQAGFATTEDGTLCDSNDGSVLRRIGHAGKVVFAERLRDGRVVSASRDATARLWDGEHDVAVFLGHTAAITNAALRPDDQQLATAAEDNTCRLWNLRLTWERRHVLVRGEAERGIWIYGIEYDPRGHNILVGEILRTSVVDTGTADIVLRHWGYGSRCEWQRAGAIVAGDGVIGRLDPLSGVVQSQTVPPHLRYVESLGERQLWSGDEGIEVRRVTTGDTLLRRPDSHCATLGHGGSRLAIATADRIIEILDLDTGKLLQTMGPVQAAVAHLVFAPGSSRIVSLDVDGHLVEWDVARGSRCAQTAANKGVRPVWDPTERWIAFGGLQQLSLLDTATGNSCPVQALFDETPGAGFNEMHGGAQISFSPDGRRMVSTLTGEWVAGVFDTATGRQVLRLRGDSSARARFSPDGSTIATCSMNVAVQWDGVRHGVRLRETEPLRAVMDRLRSAPDGETATSAPMDRRARQILQAERDVQTDAAARSAVFTIMTRLVADSGTQSIDLEALSSQLAQAQEQGSVSWDIGRARAIVRYRQGLFAEAAAWLDEDVAKSEMGPNLVSLAFLAMAESRLGEREAAAEALESLMEYSPDLLGSNFGGSLGMLQNQAKSVFAECFPEPAGSTRDRR